MQTMDIIAFRPRNWFGRMIAWLTNSKYSHVALVYDGSTRMIIEATYIVKTTDLAEEHRKYDVFRIKTDLSIAQVTIGKRYLTGMLDKGYDIANLVDWFINVFRRALNRPYRPYWQKDDRPICSELVANTYAEMRLFPVPGIPNWAVSPQDLVSSPLFEEVIS